MKITVVEGLEHCNANTLRVLTDILEDTTIYFNNTSGTYWFYDFKWRGFWVSCVNGIAVDELEIRVERI